MSRTLLFKGKRKSDGEWIEGGYFQEDYTDKEYIICWNSTGLGYNEFFEVCSETVCQYTGLTDENGNRIWENDIVKCGRNVLVTWDNHFASWCLTRKGWLYKHFFGESQEPQDCEVIGNIFDNPELLEGCNE